MSSELIRILKNLDIIFRKDVKLKNAGASGVYFDVKKAYGSPLALNSIADELWARMDKGTTCVATSGYGGMAPAAVISAKHNLNLVLVRDEPKKYGKGGWIDGYVPNERDKIAIVDDVFTTGGSLREIIEVLKPYGAKIQGCYVVVKRGEGKLSVPLVNLFTPNDFI